MKDFLLLIVVACAIVAVSVFCMTSCSSYKQSQDAEREKIKQDLRESRKDFEDSMKSFRQSFQ